MNEVNPGSDSNENLPHLNLAEPGTVEGTLGTKTKSRGKKVLILASLFILLAGSLAYAVVVNKISPTLELLNAYSNTYSVASSGNLHEVISLHITPDVITKTLNISDADIAKENIGSIKNAKDLADQINKMGMSFTIENQPKDKNLNASFAYTYSGMDIFTLEVINRVVYAHTSAMQIANIPNAPFTKSNLDSLLNYSNGATGSDKKMSDMLTSFINGTALSYSLKKGTTEGDGFDKYVASYQKSLKQSFTYADLKKLEPIMSKAIEANGSVSRAGNDANGDKIALKVNLQGVMKDLTPEFIGANGIGKSLAKSLGVTDRTTWNKMINELPKEMSFITWVKDNKISLVQVNLGKLIASTYDSVNSSVAFGMNKSYDALAKSNVASVSNAIITGIATGSLSQGDPSGTIMVGQHIISDAGITPTDSAKVYINSKTNAFCVSRGKYSMTNLSNEIDSSNLACKDAQTRVPSKDSTDASIPKVSIPDDSVSITLSLKPISPLTPPVPSQSIDALVNDTFTQTQKQMQDAAYLAATEADTVSVGQEITSLVSDYTNFGTKSGTITVPGNIITFSPMVNASGIGQATMKGPLAETTYQIRLSTGTKMVDGKFDAGKGMTWCVIFSNHNAYAKYTEQGLVDSGLDKPLSCSNITTA